MPHLTDLLAEANERGLRVNNLFQLADWSWQANLRTDDYATEYGRGHTPEDALTAALDRALEIVPLTKQTCVGRIVDDSMNLSEVMSLVSITKPNPFRGRL